MPLAIRSRVAFREKLVARFTEVVRQNNLGLDDVQKIVEKVSKYRALAVELRTQTMDVNADIKIVWEDVLEDIVFQINSDQRDLFDGIDEYIEGSNLPVWDEVPTTAYRYQTQQQIPTEAETTVQCPNCYNIQPESKGCKCVQCGNRSIFNPNW